MIRIKPDWKTKHRFAVAPKSAVKDVSGREFSAEYFEVSNGGEGDVNMEKNGGKLTATLAGEPLRKLDSKVFKDKENFTIKEIISFVTTGLLFFLKIYLDFIISLAGIQIIVSGVVMTLGGLNLKDDVTGGETPET